jgi:hypothetical protein
MFERVPNQTSSSTSPLTHMMESANELGMNREHSTSTTNNRSRGWSLTGTWENLKKRLSGGKTSTHRSSSAEGEDEQQSKRQKDGSNRGEEEEVSQDGGSVKSNSRRNSTKRRDPQRRRELEQIRRLNMEGLYRKLSGLLGMDPGVTDRNEVLTNAKEYLEEPE